MRSGAWPFEEPTEFWTATGRFKNFLKWSLSLCDRFLALVETLWVPFEIQLVFSDHLH